MDGVHKAWCLLPHSVAGVMTPTQCIDRAIVWPSAPTGQGTEAYNFALTYDERGEHDLLSARDEKSWYRLPPTRLDADLYEKAVGYAARFGLNN